jgi:hypothetical protein
MREKTALARWLDDEPEDDPGSTVVALGAALLIALAILLMT